MSAGSAPPKTSCQRRPSVVTSRMLRVLVFHGRDAVGSVRLLDPAPAGTTKKQGRSMTRLQTFHGGQSHVFDEFLADV